MMVEHDDLAGALSAAGIQTSQPGANGWREGKCPAHDDRVRSFGYLVRDDGSVAVKCHAGCSRRDILAALGFQMVERQGSDGRARDVVRIGGADREVAPAPDPIPESTIVMPIPRGVPAPEELLINRGRRPSKVWWYRDHEGAYLLAVVRWDPPEGRKVIRHLTLHRAAGGGYSWRLGGIPRVNRPLYGLDRLAARPEAPVLVVEGEKTADAAGEVFPGWVAVSPLGGASAIRLQDWSPLHGRDTVAWPDGDRPGIEDMELLCRHVPHVRLVEPLPWVTPGWDLADPAPDGLDLNELLRRAPTPTRYDRAALVASSVLFRPWEPTYTGPYSGAAWPQAVMQ